MNKEKFIKDVIRKNGANAQMIKAVEEMAELIAAICRFYLRSGEETKEQVKEELADVVLVTEQQKRIFDLSDLETEERIQRKVDRYIEEEGHFEIKQRARKRVTPERTEP